MEFVTFSDAWRELAGHGVESSSGVPGTPPPPAVLPSLRLRLASRALTVCLAGSEPAEEQVPIAGERLPEALDLLLHKLHLAPVLALPRTRWREVFDAVTFSLAENTAWQEVEGEATVILNTRDPLLFSGGDLKVLRAMLAALLADGQREEEAVTIVPLSGRVLAEISPGPAARLEISSKALADSIVPLLRSLA